MIPSISVFVVKGFSGSFSGKLSRRDRKMKYLVQTGWHSEGMGLGVEEN